MLPVLSGHFPGTNENHGKYRTHTRNQTWHAFSCRSSEFLSHRLYLPSLVTDVGELPPKRLANTRVYPKVSGLAAWSENCKRYSSLPLDAVVSLFCESV
jgi:hypothetical protein